MGRQYQGLDRPRVRQVPKGSEEQGEMEETLVVKSSVVTQTTLAVKGQMMIMIN